MIAMGFAEHCTKLSFCHFSFLIPDLPEMHKLRISAKIAKMEKDQMRNTEIAYAKNRRAQKKFERELYGPFGEC